MLKLILPFIFLFVALTNTSSAQIISFGKFSIGQSRIHADLKDFFIHSSHPDIAAAWVPGSVQWIRNENNLLVPRALLKIVVRNNSSLVHVNYHNSIIFPVLKNNYLATEIYVDLFNPDTTLVYSGSQLLGKITIEAKAVANARSKQLVDYSCSPYNLKIEGIDSEYLSVGCKMNRLGKFGNEHPRLEITLSSTNLRTLNDSKPPYTIFLNDNSPVEIQMKGVDQKIKTFHIEANLPARLHRFKTSLGFGPYIFQSDFKAKPQIKSLAPSLMIYGKFDINETSSIKAFDALLYSRTLFNNSGLYFSYDLAEAFDGRILIDTLLGFQGLHFKYATGSPTIFKFIYPQGFEVIYKHAFMENYHLVYGMFLSTTSESYTNAWLRYGKKNFIELNYIQWSLDQSHIKMLGLSVGIPLFNTF